MWTQFYKTNVYAPIYYKIIKYDSRYILFNKLFQ